MKRKEYQKPTMQVVKLQPIKILASSDNGDGHGEGFTWD